VTRRDLAINLLVLLGLAAIVTAAWLISQPLGLGVAGVALLVVALVLAGPTRSRP
jgi:hypothetical protein